MKRVQHNWGIYTRDLRKLTSLFNQELMSHPKGGEGAFNYVVTASSKVLAVL